jgi:hypothetical protein
MSVARCPSCSVPLTHDEANGRACPICGSPLTKTYTGSVTARRTAPSALDNDMRRATGPPPRNTRAVTILGVVNLLLGGVSMGLGATAFYLRALFRSFVGEAHARFMLLVLADLYALIGIVLLLLGVAWMLAGLGVLRRQQWGRILTYILAVLAILIGLGSLTAGLVPGVVLVLYGIPALRVLIRNSVEFSP